MAKTLFETCEEIRNGHSIYIVYRDKEGNEIDLVELDWENLVDLEHILEPMFEVNGELHYGLHNLKTHVGECFRQTKDKLLFLAKNFYGSFEY